MNVPFRPTTIAALSVLLWACGTAAPGGGQGGGSATGGGSGSGGGVPDISTACADEANARCGKLNSCEPYALKIRYGDSATCVDRVGRACTAQSQAAGTGLTAPAVEACSNALAGAGCDDFVNDAVAACRFTGTLANGAACGDDSQCSNGFCNNLATGVCGTCASVSGEGGPCGKCLPGFQCGGMAPNWVCVKLGVLGDACDDQNYCEPSLYCSSAGHVCRAPAAAGASCIDYSECAGGLFCNANHVCAALGVAATGEPCGNFVSQNQRSFCSAGGVCRGNDPTGQVGACAAPAADGAACQSDDDCMTLATCVSGTCTFPDPAACQ